MSETVNIANKWRTPVLVHKTAESIVIRTVDQWLILDKDEADALARVIRGEAHIQRFPAGKSPQGDEKALP